MSILPVLTYSAQSCSPAKSQKYRLGVCQRAIERSILGVKRIDRIINTWLRSKTGNSDVKLKWDWAGHVTRMHPERWAKITTEWIPTDGRRHRDRPKNRWRDLGVFLRDR